MWTTIRDSESNQGRAGSEMDKGDNAEALGVECVDGEVVVVIV